MPQTLIDLDIRKGDTLTLAGRDYPVKAVQTYKTAGFRGGTFRRMATERATISRGVSDGNGNYVPSVLYSDLLCTPLDPQTYEDQRRDVLNTPEGLLQTYLSSPNGFYKVLVEDLKK